MTMDAKTIELVDGGGRLVAVAHVADEGTHYAGTVDLSATPQDVRSLFDSFAEMVNSQQFSCADAIEEKIDALAIRAMLEGGCTAPVSELQVFPEDGTVSFKIGASEGVNGSVEPKQRAAQH